MNPEELNKHIRENLPSSFLEDQGHELTDKLYALFHGENHKPEIGLFSRTMDEHPYLPISGQFTLPIAVAKDESVHAIIKIRIGGFFKPKVSLTLEDKDCRRHLVEVPIARLASGYEDSFNWYVKWASEVSAYRVPMPECMYARNIRWK